MKLPKVEVKSLQDRGVYIAVDTDTGDAQIVECRFDPYAKPGRQWDICELGWDIPREQSEFSGFWGPIPDFELEGK